MVNPINSPVEDIQSIIENLQERYLRDVASWGQDYHVDIRDSDKIKSLQQLVTEGNATLGNVFDNFAFVCMGINLGRQKLKNVCEELEQYCIPGKVITVERAYTTQFHVGGGFDSDSHIYQMDREIVWNMGVLTKKIKFDLLKKKITFPMDTSIEKGRYSSWDSHKFSKNNEWIQKKGALHFFGDAFLNWGIYVDNCNAKGDFKSLPPTEREITVFRGQEIIQNSRYSFTEEDYITALEMLGYSK